MTRRRRYAVVGTGGRGLSFVDSVAGRFKDDCELVGHLRHEPRPDGVLQPPRRRRAWRPAGGSLRSRGLRRHGPADAPRHRHRDDGRRLPPSVHREGDGAGLRRDHREADDHRRRQVPRDHGRGAPHRPRADGGLQLPLAARLHAGTEAAPGGHDRRDRPRRPVVSARHEPRRRLLPPLAPGEGQVGRPAGAQGHPPLRPGQLVAGRGARDGIRAWAAWPSTAGRTRSGAA